MRTDIIINDELMADALEASGCKTKKEAVDQGLRLLVQRGRQQQIRQLRGKVAWDGDLDALRGAE